jgi:uncharacterized protein (TIGR03435 family)
MRVWSVRFFLAAFVAIAALGQQAFEVASIRPTIRRTVEFSYLSPSGSPSFIAASATLDDLIRFAWNVGETQLGTRPDWLSFEHYDVSAKPSGPNTRLSYEELRPMLRKLLEDRFHLALHIETKEVPGYALVVVVAGRPKLKASTDESQHRNYVTPDTVAMDRTAIADFARALTRAAGRPVVDGAGLKGRFDFYVKYSGDVALDAALRTQLGLSLEQRQVAFDTIVVDHAERIPEEN